jgi:hypothetical protein
MHGPYPNFRSRWGPCPHMYPGPHPHMRRHAAWTMGAYREAVRVTCEAGAPTLRGHLGVQFSHRPVVWGGFAVGGVEKSMALLPMYPVLVSQPCDV